MSLSDAAAEGSERTQASGESTTGRRVDLTVKIDRDTHRELKYRTFDEDTTIQAVGAALIAAWARGDDRATAIVDENT